MPRMEKKVRFALPSISTWEEMKAYNAPTIRANLQKTADEWTLKIKDHNELLRKKHKEHHTLLTTIQKHKLAHGLHQGPLRTLGEYREQAQVQRNQAGRWLMGGYTQPAIMDHKVDMDRINAWLAKAEECCKTLDKLMYDSNVLSMTLMKLEEQKKQLIRQGEKDIDTKLIDEYKQLKWNYDNL